MTNTPRRFESTDIITIDNRLHSSGDELTCLYSTDANQIGQKVTVAKRNGKAVLIKIPAAGFVIFE